ncbi:hypothetical protein [Pendulispora albinea]|uniref:Uncharacterized protein n=1 Tax=Pendulispora albinea TaxID=2741071 RepID=A0ABZ2MB12_9BACT
MPNPTSPKVIDDVWGSGPRNIWAVGQDGRMLHYDGATWSVRESGTAHHLSAVRGHGDHVFVDGRKGAIAYPPRS